MRMVAEPATLAPDGGVGEGVSDHWSIAAAGPIDCSPYENIRLTFARCSNRPIRIQVGMFMASDYSARLNEDKLRATYWLQNEPSAIWLRRLA